MTAQTHTQTAWTVSPYYAPDEDADPLGVFRIKEIEAEAQKWDDTLPDTDPGSEEEQVALDRREAVTESARRLIAAAPDLLAACKELINHLDSLPDDTEKCRHLKLALNNRAGDLMLAAIAKAEGRAGQ